MRRLFRPLLRRLNRQIRIALEAGAPELAAALHQAARGMLIAIEAEADTARRRRRKIPPARD